MATEAAIEAVIAALDAALKVDGQAPFPFYPRELRKLAEAAIAAADKARAPSSFQCADGAELRKKHRDRALRALAEHRCATDLTDGFCGPSFPEATCRQRQAPRSCIVQAEGLLKAIESRGMSVVWDYDPCLVVNMEKRQ